MIIPSWNISVARGIEPGDMPPTSEWWARLAMKKAARPWSKTGAMQVMSGKWVPPW